MMKQMMELSKLNENHKFLTSLDGKWNYTVKMWMNGDPTSKPDVSHGSATRQSIMGGRYVVMDVKGNMDMPGPDGKLQTMEFKGRGTEGYDNVQKKFVATWIDNMGTSIMMMNGTYDEASKTFTYTGEYEPMPGMHQKDSPGPQADRQGSHDDGMVRRSRRTGSENDADRLHSAGKIRERIHSR